MRDEATDNPGQVRFLNRRTPPHLVTLVAAAAMGPIAMNLFLPALPEIARYFDTEFALVQVAVSGYLAATALLQLIIGPLSDQYGRRSVLIGSMILGLISTLCIIYAPTIEIFLIARILQGVSVAGMVISRAVVRDMVGTDEAASRIGYLTMAMMIAPMIGPVIGGHLSEIYGWQSTFWLVFAYGIVALMLIWVDMGETHRSLGGGFGSQVAAYPQLFKSRRFWGYALSAGFASGAYFAFMGGGPYLAVEYYHLTPSQYGYFFVFIATGYGLGNFLSGVYARRIGVNKMMMTGSLLATVGMIAALLAQIPGWHNSLEIFLPLAFVAFGNGVLLPSANAGVVSARPRLAGSASGLGGFVQIGSGAFLAFVGGAVLGPDTGPMPLILLMFGSSLFSVATALYVVWVSRQLAKAGQEPSKT